MRRNGLLVLGVWMILASASFAQQWAQDMFKETTHDFGVVARGAKAEYAFRFENIFLEDVRISSVRSNCGCTTTKYPTDALKTYAKADIVATLDTRGFLGRKDATLTVVFDKPFSAEVQLHVHAFIRSDVVFQPGMLDFGSVKQGEPVRRKTTISYAGRDDWAITGVECPNPALKTQLTEVSRYAGRVTYDLAVETTPDATPGYLGGYLILKTNDTDPQKASVPLAVEGTIVPALNVRPKLLTFLAADGEALLLRNLIVQGQQPFRILEITCPDPRLSFKISQEPRKFHLVPVSFRPGSTPGKTDTTIRIHTNSSEESILEVAVHTEVVPSKRQNILTDPQKSNDGDTVH